jgi:hypothetical protein
MEKIFDYTPDHGSTKFDGLQYPKIKLLSSDIRCASGMGEWQRRIATKLDLSLSL